MTWNNPHFWTFDIDIALNARVSEFPPLAVPALMLSESHTLPCTHRSCFVIFRFMAKGQSPITIVSFCSFGLISSAVYTYQVMTKLSKFRLSSASRQVTWDHLHWNYFYKHLLMLKCTTGSLRNTSHIIWTKYQSSVVFRK